MKRAQMRIHPSHKRSHVEKVHATQAEVNEAVRVILYPSKVDEDAEREYQFSQYENSLLTF